MPPVCRGSPRTRSSDATAPRLSGGLPRSRLMSFCQTAPGSFAAASAGDKPACKPDSVPRQRRRPSIWDRCCHRPRAIYPQASGGQPACADCRVAALLDLAPGGVCRATAVTCGAGGLLHHRFTLTPLSRGGLLSVALSRGSPRVGVTHHLALWSPDFPRPGHPAAAARPACQEQG